MQNETSTSHQFHDLAWRLVSRSSDRSPRGIGRPGVRHATTVGNSSDGMHGWAVHSEGQPISCCNRIPGVFSQAIATKAKLDAGNVWRILRHVGVACQGSANQLPRHARLTGHHHIDVIGKNK